MWPEPGRVIYLLGRKMQGILKNYSEKNVDYFLLSKKGMKK